MQQIRQQSTSIGKIPVSVNSRKPSFCYEFDNLSAKALQQRVFQCYQSGRAEPQCNFDTGWQLIGRSP
jgi:hypothetical protein